MLTKFAKRAVTKTVHCTMRILPVIIPVLLVIHANSSASIINGQPKPPESLRKYRKF